MNADTSETREIRAQETRAMQRAYELSREHRERTQIDGEAHLRDLMRRRR